LHCVRLFQFRNGSAGVALLKIYPAKLHLRKEERRIQLRCPASFSRRLLKLTLSGKSKGVINRDDRIERIEFRGALTLGKRFIELALAAKNSIRIDRERRRNWD
jgi:hypothetical protein